MPVTEKFKKLFFNTKISLPRLVAFSLIIGAIVGIIMVPEFLQGTSLENMGVCFETWIFFAMIIILNCEKPVEAGFKTFIFFLISQPVIYLVQVPVSPLGWGLFGYYPRWFVLTLLTLPGGCIAWLCKKGNILSAIIWSVAVLLLCFGELPYHLAQLFSGFPKQLLACMFIIAEVIILTFMIFKEKKLKITVYSLAVAFTLAGMLYQWKIL